MSDNPKPFIPAELDDAGLPANQFRVLCHLLRRGETFSNAATIGKICRLKRDTVFEILAELEKAGFIRRTSRPGKTTLIEPAPVWGTGINSNPPRFGGQDPPRSGGQDPPRFGGHKGNTIKAIPLRQSQDALELPFQSESFKEAWTDWQQHRREKKASLTPTSIKKQFKELAAWGEARAIAAINHSISRGWQGIFEPSATGSNSKPQKADDFKL